MNNKLLNKFISVIFIGGFFQREIIYNRNLASLVFLVFLLRIRGYLGILWPIFHRIRIAGVFLGVAYSL